MFTPSFEMRSNRIRCHVIAVVYNILTMGKKRFRHHKQYGDIPPLKKIQVQFHIDNDILSDRPLNDKINVNKYNNLTQNENPSRIVYCNKTI